jgi:hypothetical protein
MNSHADVRSGQSPPGSAPLSFRAIRSEPSALGARDAGRVEHDRGRPGPGELCDPAQWIGVGERALELGVDDHVDVGRFVAASVADRVLALGVGPAGAVGDHLAGVAREQLADDLPQRAQLGVA